MNQLSIVLLLLLVLSVGFGGYKWSDLSQRVKDAEALLQHEGDLRRINVSSSTLSDESKFVFANIKNQYSYYYNKGFTRAGMVVDSVKIIYAWDYTFSFGVEIPNEWNWCVKDIPDQPGYVQVNSPEPSFLSSNPPSPKEVDIINGSNSTNDLTRSREMAEISLARVNADAEQYLDDPSLKKTIRLAFSKHLQEVMNSSHQESNPVAGVVLNYVETSSCD